MLFERIQYLQKALYWPGCDPAILVNRAPLFEFVLAFHDLCVQFAFRKDRHKERSVRTWGNGSLAMFMILWWVGVFRNIVKTLLVIRSRSLDMLPWTIVPCSEGDLSVESEGTGDVVVAGDITTTRVPYFRWYTTASFVNGTVGWHAWTWLTQLQGYRDSFCHGPNSPQHRILIYQDQWNFSIGVLVYPE